LPRAIEENLQLIAALKRIAESPLAQSYEAAAAKAEWPEARRYCLDIARELYFLKARDALYTRLAAEPYAHLEPSKTSGELMSLKPGKEGYTLGDSLRYWKASVGVEAFVEHYGAGQLVEARQDLERLVQK
jgi:hypothetical protein